jgi:Flp pilus assembly protein TadD
LVLRHCFQIVLVVLLAGVLGACRLISINTGFRPDPVIEEQLLFRNQTEIPDPGLLTMTPDMEAYLAEHVDPKLYGWDLVVQLQSLLFSDEYLGIVYDDAANLSASGVFTERRANCLSLVNLYITFARHLDLQVEYQTAKVRPTWNRRGELLVVSEHINALGRLTANSQYVVDFTPEVQLQQASAKTITDQEALALYFNNLAVERLINGDTDGAREKVEFALALDPSLDIAWNNLGSILGRLGQGELAEYSYQKAFWLNRNNASAISNLARLYDGRGDVELATKYAAAVEDYKRRNPYYHYMLGNAAFEEGEFADAQRHFERAIRRNDLEPDFYLALGLTHQEMGDEELGEELLLMGQAMRALGDQRYRSSQSRLRRIDNRSILRSTSAGIRVEFQ